ncbi:uncharacterized protein K452DRAFT_35488 [Aplosporella prunicola CBS 121167]|uniref:Uncharacterized protein n=1 Tax=Aplosporella prunicola CBS 121167 TaxID=1176127 RepID=A0A6A6AVS6_9PEZI|nr:uncharacterized protein K452DRAFT_35488 [Aplosporella prunicola CBS 121167]KAF2135293.1 hypothetical protein K452DRAFT_35488 [Aplosporella prunicola CBS 121167]
MANSAEFLAAAPPRPDWQPIGVDARCDSIPSSPPPLLHQPPEQPCASWQALDKLTGLRIVASAPFWPLDRGSQQLRGCPLDALCTAADAPDDAGRASCLEVRMGNRHTLTSPAGGSSSWGLLTWLWEIVDEIGFTRSCNKNHVTLSSCMRGKKVRCKREKKRREREKRSNKRTVCLSGRRVCGQSNCSGLLSAWQARWRTSPLPKRTSGMTFLSERRCFFVSRLRALRALRAQPCARVPLSPSFSRPRQHRQRHPDKAKKEPTDLTASPKSAVWTMAAGAHFLVSHRPSVLLIIPPNFRFRPR